MLSPELLDECYAYGRSLIEKSRSLALEHLERSYEAPIGQVGGPHYYGEGYLLAHAAASFPAPKKDRANFNAKTHRWLKRRGLRGGTHDYLDALQAIYYGVENGLKPLMRVL